MEDHIAQTTINSTLTCCNNSWHLDIQCYFEIPV